MKHATKLAYVALGIAVGMLSEKALARWDLERSKTTMRRSATNWTIWMAC